ncbi:MAG: class I mannose-6-phosphate isomerase [Acidobacteriota bacterium]|nr:class I mannose-6-phosphate isomerase [Acidobacteriota bacterium]
MTDTVVESQPEISHLIMQDFSKPVELFPIFRERVWGRESLEPIFPDQAAFPDQALKERIGEVWFTFEENMTSEGKNLKSLLSESPEILGNAAEAEHPGICPILLKLLFTTERLSVQVHPGDDYAQEHHRSLGKTEAWYVLDSQPPGELAVGFRETLTPERFLEAAQSGEIEQLLDWRKAKPGDVVFTPAGTVHAIGAGLTVCEIQENSDITYRLYDYGRLRELHLEHGVKVSQLGPYRHESTVVRLADGRDELVACRYFRMERLRPEPGFRIKDLPFYVVALCVKGVGTVGRDPFRAGQAWLLPAGGEIAVDGPGSEWIVTYSAERAAAGIV